MGAEETVPGLIERYFQEELERLEDAGELEEGDLQWLRCRTLIKSSFLFNVSLETLVVSQHGACHPAWPRIRQGARASLDEDCR